MSVIFPITASLLFRQTTGPWYNGSNAPGSGSGGELSYDNMDYNWYNLNLASYQIIQTIKGAAYTGSSNTFTQPNTFLSNVGISGSLTGSTARFSGQLISSFPGVGFVGTASWALNVVGGGGGGTQNLQSVTTIGNQTSASVILLGGVTGSSFTGSFTGSFLGSLFGTSSYALSALSSSYSVTSSYSLTALSSSYAVTASYVKITGSNGLFVNYGPNGIELTQSFVYPNLQDVTTLGNQTSESIQITGSLSNGFQTLAVGLFTHAEGIQTTAISDYSHAEGSNTTTLADISHAEGYYTTTLGNQSHAEGEYTITIGGSSHAEGYQTTAKGIASHVEGNKTIAFGTGSHAEGTGSLASGSYSHAEGYLNIAKGIASHAEGVNTTSVGLYSHAEGSSTTSIGAVSHAEGVTTTAIGQTSHAEGAITTAVGESSHAEGYFSKSIGSWSHAEGVLSRSVGNQSHAEGGQTTAIGDSSHAEGAYTTAKGNDSHAEGLGTITSTKQGQHVEGTYNIEDSNAIWVVGDGASAGSRSNLIAAYTDRLTVTGSLQVTGSIISNGPVVITGSGNYLTLPVITGSSTPDVISPYNTTAVPIGSMVLRISTPVSGPTTVMLYVKYRNATPPVSQWATI